MPTKKRLTETTQHPEAFCTMIYQCEKCGSCEILWNSRDGVTPFLLGCLACDGMMKHVLWNQDPRNPKYREEMAYKGKGAKARMFVSATKENLDKYLASNCARQWKQGASAYYENLEEFVNQARKNYEEAGHDQPMCVPMFDLKLRKA